MWISSGLLQNVVPETGHALHTTFSSTTQKSPGIGSVRSGSF
jgi:hypothetical protein